MTAEELDGLPSSAFVAKSFTGAKVVKGFNHLGAAILATDPIVEGGHRVVFLSSDDEDAIAPVAELAKRLGFAPVELGKFSEGGALVHVYTDGSIRLNHGGTEMGQGLFIKVAQVVAEVFKVDIDRIRPSATYADLDV